MLPRYWPPTTLRCIERRKRRVQNRTGIFLQVLCRRGRIESKRRLVDEQEFQQIPRVGQDDDARLHEVRRNSERRFVDVGADVSVLHQERLQTTGEVGRLEQTNVLGIDRVGLLLVEAGRIGVDLGDVEGRNHLVEREDIVIVGDAPPSRAR